MTGPTLGLDIGGTKVLGVVLDDTGTIVREARRPSPVSELGALVDACARIVEELGVPNAAVGVGAAGLVDNDGRLTYAPNIPGVRDAPLRNDLARATGRAVVVDNDANLAALAELHHGAAAGARTVLMVTLGTGIGGGIVIDGGVYRGANGFAGEIGHVTVERDGPECACGELGHWEAIASGHALGRMAREAIASGKAGAVLAAAHGDLVAVGGEEVATAARSGDTDAQELIDRYADNIALGLANLANILDLERIVIAGGVIDMGALLLDPLRVAFAARLEGTEHRPEIPILPAALGSKAGAVGAALLAAVRGPLGKYVVRLGITLPSFVDDPEIPLEVARRADTVGLDGVFVFDHLWRDVPPPRRPALECFSLLGAVAAETERVQLGPFVARVSLRPAATLAAALDTVQRVSDGRLIAAVGSGDGQTKAENEAFGVAFGDVDSRLAELAASVEAVRGRGYPVWVGGSASKVRDAVARADGWNGWGGTIDAFSRGVAEVHEVAPGALVTWGGLVLLGRDEDHTAEKARSRKVGPHVVAGGPERVANALRAYADAGASWIVVGPLDAADPDNVDLLADHVLPRLR